MVRIMKVTETWDRIESWLIDNASGVYRDLNPPASSKDISDLEDSIALRLPDDLRESYLRHNGHSGHIVESVQWLSVAAIYNHWELMKLLHDTHGFANLIGYSPDSEWWSVKWVPFMFNPAGKLLCATLEPTANSLTGQIILYSHNSREREIVSVGFGQFLEQLCLELEAGAYMYDDDNHCLIAKSLGLESKSVMQSICGT